MGRSKERKEKEKWKSGDKGGGTEQFQNCLQLWPMRLV